MDVREQYAESRCATRAGVTTAFRRFTVADVGGAAVGRDFRAKIAPGIPVEGDAHTEIVGCVVVSVEARSIPEHSDRFNVDVNYSTDPPSTGSELSLSDPVEVTTRPIENTETVTTDINGDSLRTDFSLPFNVGFYIARASVPRPSSVIDITMTSNQSAANLNRLYGGRVNSTNWSGYLPKTIRCDYFSDRYEGGSSLYRVTGTFSVAGAKHGDWRLKVEALAGGAPIADITEGNGIEFYDVYDSLDLGASGFVIP